MFRAALALTALTAAGAADSCSGVVSRSDCGYAGITEDECQSQGCCWSPAGDGSAQPWCFQPSLATGYSVTSSSQTDAGVTLQLALQGAGTDTFGADLPALAVDVAFETNERARVRVYDPTAARWEVPEDLLPLPATTSAKNPLYNITYTEEGSEAPFSFQVTRLADGAVLFDSGSSLVFKDQYIEVATPLPAGEDTALFGLGESTRSAGMRLTTNTTYTLWAHDTPAAVTDQNLYASHPFFLAVDSTDGDAHGAFIRNSNGMDIEMRDSTLTYKILGGVLDVFVFAGPTPADVSAQYLEAIGRPTLLPYWSLGFHDCRYGYESIGEIEAVAANYTAADIPVTTYWADIDYLDAFRDFTTDPVNFPASEVGDFINGLAKNGQHFVPILDPGIMVFEDYPSYEEGLEQGLFIADATGAPYLGQVWPGPVNFPDFLSHPNATDYWAGQIGSFYDLIGASTSGLWIDMNEVSNFCTGTTCTVEGECPSPGASQTDCCLVCETDETDPLEFPPYAINNNGGRAPLGDHTMAMNAVHYGGQVQYNTHNLYGLSEAKSTNAALQALTGERPFVLSRSTFPGSGVYTAHWTGDNDASWADLWYSIQGTLNGHLFGLPAVGADICGFNGDTTEELCLRWIQLGAFTPFSRDHSAIGTIPQELYRWESVAAAGRQALGLRYELLPYLYTSMYEAHTTGALAARPLFLEFPDEAAALVDNDRQFLMGGSVLVSPVLAEGATSVEAYLPAGVWYNAFDLRDALSSSGHSLKFDAPLDAPPVVHLRGGSVIPTTVTETGAFGLKVLLDEAGEAQGSLYVDDGVSVSPDATIVAFSMADGQLTSTVSQADYSPEATLGSISVAGVASAVSGVTVNGDSVQYVFQAGVLVVKGLDLAVEEPFSLVISPQ